MTATTRERLDVAPAHHPFAGLRALVRKDVTEWIRGRRAIVIFAVTTVVMILAAANAWIISQISASLPPDAERPPLPESVAPLDNLWAGIGTQIFILAAIFAVAGLLARERESGTLAWVASKPVSRDSIWLSKLISASGALAVTAVIAPIAVTTFAVVVLYGMPEPLVVALAVVGAIAVVIFYAAVGLAAATVVPGQPAVAAIGFLVFALGPVVSGMLPSLAPYLPTSMLTWSVGLGTGASVGWVTPLSWLVGVGLLGAFALDRMRKLEL